MSNEPRAKSNPVVDRKITLSGGMPLALPVIRRSSGLGTLGPVVALLVAANPGLGWAADNTAADPQPSSEQLTEITISAAAIHSIDQFTPTGSRLGLSIQELPATLNVISF